MKLIALSCFFFFTSFSSFGLGRPMKAQYSWITKGKNFKHECFICSLRLKKMKHDVIILHVQ